MQSENNSKFDLLKGSYTSNDKFWQKFVNHLLLAAFWLAAFWIIKEWIISVIGFARISNFSLPDFISIFKGRSP